MANSIVGVANRVSNASGALVFGAGNQITNSLQNDDTLSGVLPTSTNHGMTATLYSFPALKHALECLGFCCKTS